MQHCLWYLTINKYIEIIKIQYTIELTQYQQKEKTSISDQNAYNITLTDFVILK